MAGGLAEKAGMGGKPADGEAAPAAENGEVPPAEGEVPVEGQGGFLGGIMGKANALKAAAAEKAGGLGAGDLTVGGHTGCASPPGQG